MRELRCGSCGTLNRVRAHSIRQIPKCGKCQHALPESIGIRAARELYVWRRYFAALGVLATPLLLLIVWGLALGPADPIARRVIDCAPQPRPSSGDYFIADFSSRVAPFRVETQPGSDYLVKLESTENKLFSFVFFIVGGQPFETTVPAVRPQIRCWQNLVRANTVITWPNAVHIR
jgi:hypothetical protein